MRGSRSGSVGIALIGLVLSCNHEISGPRDTVTAVAPTAVCNAQLPTEIAISGTGFSPLPTKTLTGEQELVLPAITLVREKELDGTAADPAAAGATVLVPDDPSNPSASDVTWTDQAGMSFFVCPAGTCSVASPARTDYALATGLYSISVKNRNDSPAAIIEAALAVLPPPALASLDPDLLCKDQECQFKLTGDWLIRIDATRSGKVTVGTGADAKDFTPVLSDCRALPSPNGMALEACRTATVTVPAKAFAAGKFTVVFTDPDPVRCHSTETRILTFVPEPTVTEVVPDLECLDEAAQSMIVNGSGFLSIDGVLPTVIVDAGHTFTAASVDGCTTVDGPRETVLTCARLVFALPTTAVPPGVYDVKVKNPAPADCVSSTSAKLTVVPAPTLTSVSPELACNAQHDLGFTVTGTGFLTVDGTMPAVKLGSYTTAAATATGCTSMADVKESVQVCTGLTFSVPTGTLAAGASYALTITNPQTAECSTAQSVGVVIIAPPSLTSITPDTRCSAQSGFTLTLTGDGFLSLDGVLPTVTIGTNSFAAASVSSCTAITGLSVDAQLCTTMTVAVPAATLPAGDLAVVVHNPGAGDCVSTEGVILHSTTPPVLTGASPTAMCRGGATIIASGDGFAPGMSATLGGLAAGDVSLTGTTSAALTFGAGLSAGGPYDLTVANPDGCSATLAGAVSVSNGPIVFYVDPPVVYNGITTVATVFGSGVQPPVKSVQLIPSGGGTAIDLTVIIDPVYPNRAQVAIPRGTAPGSYDISVTDQSPCSAVMPNALTVVGTLNLTVSSITPPLGGTTQNTPATITGAGFVNTPRAYLSPTGGSSAATQLNATSSIDASSLTTVVRSGLPVGTYDLIVVNPDARVGVLANAFKVLATPPPEITNITPGSIPNTGSPAVMVEGQSFATGASAATVSLYCKDANGNDVPAGATPTPISAPVSAGATSTTLTVTVPAGSSAMSGAVACVVRVTNPADGSYGEYSSLTLTNPSQNLGSFQTSSAQLVTARRALAAVAARGNSAARFLYAVGGDTGEATGALDTVEAASVDIWGTLGAFKTLPYRLPRPTTYVGAVSIGRYIYVVGGHDGTGARKDVYRAVVLNPLDIPEIVNADLSIGTGSGLDGGAWTYRVSAVMPADDPVNPDGETLPSDPFVIGVPTMSSKIVVTITWKPHPGAASYRVYRSPSASAGSGSEVLIGTAGAAATSFLDSGLAAGTARPLFAGSTGKWVSIASLGVARAGAGIARVFDNPTAPTRAYLYALGGLDDGATPAALGTWEMLPITISGNTQTAASSWTAGTSAVAAGKERWQLALYEADPGNSSNVLPGQAFLYAGGGLQGDGTTVVGTVESFQVNLTTGMLAAPVAQKSMTNPVAGYGAILANNTLYAFGGGPTPSGSAVSGLICSGSGTGCGGPAPTLINNSWNALGFTITPGRYLMGSVLESSFIYLVAGATTTANSASNTVFTTIW